MKRILSAVLVILILFSLTACQDNSSNADIEAMKLQMQLMQQQLDEAKQAGYEPSAPAGRAGTVRQPRLSREHDP